MGRIAFPLCISITFWSRVACNFFYWKANTARSKAARLGMQIRPSRFHGECVCPAVILDRVFCNMLIMELCGEMYMERAVCTVFLSFWPLKGPLGPHC